jgi:hypothetical protein
MLFVTHPFCLCGTYYFPLHVDEDVYSTSFVGSHEAHADGKRFYDTVEASPFG